MNSIIRGSKFAMLAVCGAALVACNAVTDVQQSPTFARPPVKVPITGMITGIGVGNTRPVGLQIVVTNDKIYAKPDTGGATTVVTNSDGTTTRTTVYSLRGVTALNFGAMDIGATYEISVTNQPLGRTCYPDKNFAGTVTAAVSDVEIRCDRDTTTLYHVTANIDPSIAAAPPAGFKLTLTTEEGVETVIPDANQTSVTFQNPVFYPAASPPPFAYAVTATYSDNGTTQNCAVTNGSGALGALADGAPGDITNVMVTSCTFGVSAVVSYSAPPDGAPQVMGMNGVTLGLKDASGAIVSETAPITAFSATPVPFPGITMSNAGALYQVVVTSQPDGQFCTVDNGGIASLVTAVNTSAQVRCRNVPVVANQLTGTYQAVTAPAAVSDTNPRPLATSPERHFMTFFANGTFLYGTHDSNTKAGVEAGFYAYDATAHTLAFTVHTDSSGFNGIPTCSTGDFQTYTCGTGSGTAGPAGATPSVSATVGLSGVAGFLLPYASYTGGLFIYGPPGTLTATNVTKTAAIPSAPPPSGLAGDPIIPAVGPQINLTFGAITWTLVEPIAADWTSGPYWPADSMNGEWVTADSMQSWIYNDVTSYGFHAGVNGAPNVQDVCFGVEQRSVDFGYDMFYSRRTTFSGDPYGGNVGCSPGGIGGVDVPNATSTPAIVPGFVGRMPGSSIQTVTSPSPMYFKVTPGTGGAPDTLTIQPTFNETPVGDVVVFTRSTTN